MEMEAPFDGLLIKLNTAVRHVISKCVFCRRNYSRPNEQKMADLPKNWISPAPPFTYTGVDYFGPFIIGEGRLTRPQSSLSCRYSLIIY